MNTKSYSITTHDIVDSDNVARIIGDSIHDFPNDQLTIAINGQPNSGKTTLANQIARTIAQTSKTIDESPYYDQQYGRSWQAWKSASQARLIRRMDNTALMCEGRKTCPIPSLKDNSIDLIEHLGDTSKADILIDIQVINPQTRQITIHANSDIIQSIEKNVTPLIDSTHHEKPSI